MESVYNTGTEKECFSKQENVDLYYFVEKGKGELYGKGRTSIEITADNNH